MKHSISKRRREFLAFLGAFPIGLLSVRSNAQPRQLDLTCTYPPETFQAMGAQLFADKIAQAAAGKIQVSVERGRVSLEETASMTALVVYCAPCVAKPEPLLTLSTLPMLASTFDEAATLQRIAKPYYSAALARHGQMLLATQPWLPGALWSTFPIRSVADLKGVPFAVVPSPGVASDIESGSFRQVGRSVRLLLRRGSDNCEQLPGTRAEVDAAVRLLHGNLLCSAPHVSGRKAGRFRRAVGDGATHAPWRRSRHRDCPVETHDGTAGSQTTRGRRAGSTSFCPTSCRRPGSLAYGGRTGHPSLGSIRRCGWQRAPCRLPSRHRARVVRSFEVVPDVRFGSFAADL
jgi:hypothetical protein